MWSSVPVLARSSPGSTERSDAVDRRRRRALPVRPKVRRTDSSIRLDAVAQFRGRSLAVVVDYGGPSRYLNFGHLRDPWDLRPVSSRLAWRVIRAASRLWGDTPSLRAGRITGTAASVDELGEAAYRFYQAGVRRWLG